MTCPRAATALASLHAAAAHSAKRASSAWALSTPSVGLCRATRYASTLQIGYALHRGRAARVQGRRAPRAGAARTRRRHATSAPTLTLHNAAKRSCHASTHTRGYAQARKGAASALAGGRSARSRGRRVSSRRAALRAHSAATSASDEATRSASHSHLRWGVQHRHRMPRRASASKPTQARPIACSACTTRGGTARGGRCARRSMGIARPPSAVTMMVLGATSDRSFTMPNGASRHSTNACTCTCTLTSAALRPVPTSLPPVDS